MGERIEFECRECGEPDAIDSSSLNFITSIAPLDREEALLCDHHLQEELEGIYLDLSIGTGHTRSQEFQAKREARKQEREEGKMRHLKNTTIITFVEVFHDPEWDEDKVEIEMPSEAKTDLKQLEWNLAHPKFYGERGAWTVDLKALDRAVEHMEDNGWSVEVAPTVRSRAG